MSEFQGPLAGLRVLELADEKGQFCGKLLGDLGADVVKIEPPGGEACRHVGPFLDDIPDPERSLSFWYYNTSKRGITLNLETADGRALFCRLAAEADVIQRRRVAGQAVVGPCVEMDQDRLAVDRLVDDLARIDREPPRSWHLRCSSCIVRVVHS